MILQLSSLFLPETLFAISSAPNILSSPIEYLKGVGPQKAELLKKELEIFTFKDLLEHFPFRHIDKTQVSTISQITSSTDFIQVAGVITNIELVGANRGRRLVAQLKDKTGTLELAWFQSLSWVQKNITNGIAYLVYG